MVRHLTIAENADGELPRVLDEQVLVTAPVVIVEEDGLFLVTTTPDVLRHIGGGES